MDLNKYKISRKSFTLKGLSQILDSIIVFFKCYLTQDVDWVESRLLYLATEGMSVSVKYLQAIKVFSSVMGLADPVGEST